jgi:hypothetical protein
MTEITKFLQDYNNGKPLDISVQLPRQTLIDLGVTLGIVITIAILLYAVAKRF